MMRLDLDDAGLIRPDFGFFSLSLRNADSLLVHVLLRNYLGIRLVNDQPTFN